MKALLLTAIMALGLQSVAFAAQVETKSCAQKFESTDRSAKDVSKGESKKDNKSTVKSE